MENKMGLLPIKKLIWSLGLPMIISMVLQAMYNVIDSIYVANIPGDGNYGNQALTLAFPIQILMIAIGVGTGVGINALLSKSLGEHDKEKVNYIVGNGIFLSIVIYLIFLVFGLFLSHWFISLFTDIPEVIKMGTSYLKICCTLSFGSIAYTVYERFLQATGKTIYSTISQISGALVNIIFDYVFIYPMKMGVIGAALATVFGQFVSLFVAMFFHYFFNKEINNKIKYLKPKFDVIKQIYKIGISASLMQALLSIMMAGMNIILSNTKADTTTLVGAFGIYYKIQQIALFSCFGLSNTIITVLSYNFGLKNKNRSKDCIKYGIIDTLVVSFIITILFEISAKALAQLFSLGNNNEQLILICIMSIRIASIGFIFMGFTISVQGVLQSLNYSIKPLILSFLRLVIFIFPISYLFTLSDDVINLVWWSFPISEILTSVVSAIFLISSINKKIKIL